MQPFEAIPGDFPWSERARGGSRVFTSSLRSGIVQTSQHDHHREDFLALRDAALAEISPAKKRRAAVFPEKEGSVKVLDTSRLDRQTRAELLTSVAEDEVGTNLITLQKLRARLDKAGLPLESVTVRYKHLSVLTTTNVGHNAVPTLMSSATSVIQPILDAFGRSKLKSTHAIIDDVSGILRPGALTLLLGPPGGGKTTLLKTLAGYNRREHGLRIKSEELTYNGKGFNEFRVERSSAYISQLDNHYGELTVRETFDFSARCQGAGYHVAMLEALHEAEQAKGIVPDPEVDAFMKAGAYAQGKDANLSVDITLSLLGLDVCADTVVGNAMLRGISGGQRKRVTTGELMVGPARALFADEISTGLDSNTTYSIVKSVGNLAHIMGDTVVVGLLQPSPETFDLFDDVILISNGRIPYHGPREAVMPFFESLGYYCPIRHGVADFLQEITTPSDQHKYWDAQKNSKRFRYTTTQMFLEAYQRQPYWKSMEEELAKPYAGEKLAVSSLQMTHYSQTAGEILRANFWRQLTLMSRNKLFTVIRVFQVFIMALITSSVFWQNSKDTIQDANFFYAVIFFSLLYMLIGALPDLNILIERLPVMYRQRDAKFFPGWAFALPTIVLRIPICLVEALVWSLLVYWIVGFVSSVRFLMFFFQFFLLNVWCVQLYLLIAAVARNEIIATSLGFFLLAIFFVLNGVVLNARDTRPWWLGGFWANPFSYVTRALAINEFTSSDWDKPDPINGGNLGMNALSFHGFQNDYWWCWVSVAFMVGTFFANLGVYVAAITYLNPLHSKPVMTEEGLEELTLSRKILSSQTEAHPPGDHVSESLPGRRDDGDNSEDSKEAVDVELGRGERTPHRPSSSERPPSERFQASFSAAENYRKQTAIEFQEVIMTFRDVCYSVPLPKEVDPSKADTGGDGPHKGQLRLLKNIAGAFRPHVLTALMGASGAGKTTLMDVLAGRKTEGVITGDIRINGYPKQDKTLARVMGYVEQEDIHLPQTTVQEALEFSAALRLPSTVQESTRLAFVLEMMDLVELSTLRNGFVGVPGESGLSVEQRKRLTLAVELVANPSIVFMDEPTSGLDARAASIVMNAVRNTVDTGRTVVCTIHQPSIDIFQAFDELLLLKPGGHVIYNGPMGDDSQALIEYFEAIPGVEKIRPRYNPANWMLAVSNPSAERHLGVDFSEIFERSSLAAKLEETIAANEDPKEGVPDIHLDGLHQPNQLVQFRWILQRNFRQYWRLPEYNLTRFVSTLMFGFVFGSMFWRLGSDRSTATGVLNVMGGLFASVMFMGVSNCYAVLPVANTQRVVMYRERAAGLYRILPFAAAQQLVEIPYLIVQSVVYCSIVYWMIWFQRDAGAFFWFFFFFFLTLSYFTSFGIMGVAITPNAPFANVFCSFWFPLWTLLCGFLIPEPQMRRYTFWYYYINPVSWSLYGLVESQLKNFTTETTTNFDGVVQTIPEFLKDSFNFRSSLLGPCVPILIAFTAVYMGVTVLALYKLNFQSR